MPALSMEEMNLLLDEIAKTAIPCTLNLGREAEEKAIKECDEYLENGNKDIAGMSPFSIYHVISKLSDDEKIDFIKNNIEYIKEHEKDIFLYTMYAPKSLSYFFSFKVLKELKKIDINIFKEVIGQNFENLFYGFKHEDYYDFYNEFYSDLMEVNNRCFINGLYCHNRCCYDNASIYDLNKVYDVQRDYNKEFMNYILEKYDEKINKLSPSDLLSFIEFIEDIEVYKEFIKKHYDKLNTAFYNISEYNLHDYLSETNAVKQEVLIYSFFDNIILKQDIKNIISKISPNIIIDLYKKHKEVFSPLTLKDWIKVCSSPRVFNDDFKAILDSFEIDNIEELFDTECYSNRWLKDYVASLNYVENKFRNNIKITGKLEEIDITTSIFSEKYIRNLSELKTMLQNNVISKNDECYKKHLTNFILFLKTTNTINNIEGNRLKEISNLFYRIVMGKSLTVLYELSSIEEITLLNRLGSVEFNVDDFSVEQLEKYNVKQHKQLYNTYKKDWSIKDYKKLILKLILMVGFNNVKVILSLDVDLPILEHLVGNVDVKNIKLDDQGNPILNNKIMNLLFSDNYYRLKEMLSDKTNDLYKYFPRIFSEWEMIEMNDKDKSLNVIIDFLKSDEISLPPKYYRLEGLFKFIGCNNSIVNETLELHNKMLTRLNNTIPRIKGNKDGYSYEVLRLDDVEAITVGNKTDCCFTVLGNGYSCLKHALTSNNGRVLVIKKDNELLAHSWIWRNGDLLCLDNVEISKKIDCVDFFDVYLQFADDIIRKSYECEGIENCLKNITIGYTNFDKEIKGIEKYPCLISKLCNLEHKDFDKRLGSNRKFLDVLPQPIEEVGYSDSKNVQYLIRGNGIFNLGESQYYYQDERKDIMCYSKDNNYDEEYIAKINKIINGLRYIKYENDNMLDSYKVINIKYLDEIYCNEDWYIIKYENGNVETFNISLDNRALKEYNSVSIKSAKVLKKII